MRLDRNADLQSPSLRDVEVLGPRYGCTRIAAITRAPVLRRPQQLEIHADQGTNGLAACAGATVSGG